MPIKTNSAKNKARKLQQLTRDKILETFPQLENDDVKSTSMGAPGVDIQLSPAAQKLFPWAIENKAYAKIAVYKFYEQATENKGNLNPLVVMKANHKEPLVLLSLKDFMRLYENQSNHSN